MVAALLAGRLLSLSDDSASQTKRAVCGDAFGLDELIVLHEQGTEVAMFPSTLQVDSPPTRYVTRIMLRVGTPTLGVRHCGTGKCLTYKSFANTDDLQDESERLNLLTYYVSKLLSNSSDFLANA